MFLLSFIRSLRLDDCFIRFVRLKYVWMVPGGFINLKPDASSVYVPKKNMSAQSLGGAHRDRVCMCTFIG